MFPARPLRLRWTTAIGVVAFVPWLSAQVTTWDGSSSNAWNTGANWSSGVPTGSTEAIFDADGTSVFGISLGANRNVGEITFVDSTANTGFDFTSNQLRIGSGGLTNNDQVQQRAQNIRLEANQTWDLSQGGLLLDGTLILRRNLVVNGSNELDIDNRLQLGGSRTLTINSTGGVRADILRLNGNQLTLAGAGDLTIDQTLQNWNGNRTFSNNSTGSVTLNNIVLSDDNSNSGANRTLTISGSGTTVVNGVISDGNGSTSNLTHTGTGNLTLSATNTYSGDTTVSAGTLTLAADNALGDAASSTTVASGATLALTGGITVAQATTTLAGTGTASNGAIQNLAGTNALASDISLAAATTVTSDAGTLALGSDDLSAFYYTNVLSNNGHTLTVEGAGDTNLYTALSGSGNLVKNDAGTLTLTGVAITGIQSPKFTGDVSINQGDLVLASFENSSPLLVSPAFTNYAMNSNTITIGDGTGDTYEAGGGADARLLIGTDDAAVVNADHLFNDNVSLDIRSDGAVFTQGHTQVLADVTMDGGLLSTKYDTTDGFVQITGDITSTSTTQNAVIRGQIDLVTTATTQDIQVDPGSTLGIEARITTEGFRKTGTGTLNLSGNNSYTGDTDIAGGILQADNDAALGSVSGNETIVRDGAQLQLLDVDIVGEALTLNGAGIASDGALRATTGTNTWSGTVTLDSSSRIDTATGADLTLSGSITGSGTTLTVGGAGDTTFTGANTYGTLQKTGSGQLTLSGAAKVITTTNVTAGTLTLATSDILTDTMDLDVSGGTFAMGGAITETIDTFDVSGSGNLDVDGILTMNGGTIDSTGSGASSTGTLELTAGNTLTIASNYTFGDIAETGPGTGLFAGSAGTLTLNANATLALAGGVTFNLGTLNIASGNTIIDFGASSDNTLNLGALVIADGASITVNNWASFQDLWTTASFEGGDGAVSLDVRDNNTAQITFTGFSNSQTIWLTEDFGKNEITVPEPSSYGAILMAFGLAAWRLRRPRRAAA